jgi:hypothetical protein
MGVTSPKLTQQERIESMRFFSSVIESAAQLGHKLEDEPARVKVSGSKMGQAARCSCGWQGHPKSKRFAAYREGFGHLGDVLGLEVRSKVGQSLQPVSRAV